MCPAINVYFVIVLLPFVAVAQEADSLTQRQNIIKEARALKNIYKIDEAIELLSQLVKPESLDEDVFAELAPAFENIADKVYGPCDERFHGLLQWVLHPCRKAFPKP